MSGPGAIGRAVTAIWRSRGRVGSLRGRRGDRRSIDCGRGRLAASPLFVLLAEIAAAVAVLAGAAYLVWRNWSAIVGAIRRAASAVSRDVIAIMSKLASAVMGGPEGSTREDLRPAGDAAIRRPMRSRGWSSLLSIAPAVLESVASGSTGGAAFAFMAWKQPGLWSGSQPGQLTLRKATAIAMLAAPLLAAPMLAAVPSGRQRTGTESLASVVINSAPTVVINSNQPADIEHQVLEALRQHREAIYEEWHRELRRRQRTEF